MEDAAPDPVRKSLEDALGSGYRILRLLGRGGMGAVYLAREESLERLVAVKVLSLERGLDATSRERFKREAVTAARLMHPHIVPLHTFGEAEGMMFLVMGYVSGESLAARLKRDGRLRLSETRRIVAEVAEALDHAHRQGVIHRDVKPDNVLIEDESGRALLADFGVAKALGAGTMTQVGTVVGTPAFMSPEQAAGNVHIDGRSDLYSLGALAYCLLTGRPPFEGDSRAVMSKHLTQDPPPLRSLRPDVPEDLATAVARCLAKDPGARWPDARALREAIAPTGLDEDELPEPLDALDGRAAMLLPLAILLVNLLVYAWLRQGPGLFAALLIVVTAGMLVYQLPWLVSAARLARQRGFSTSQVLHAFLREPAWWYFLWYPRRFRRGSDVWDRLPWPFRVWRVAMSLLALDLFLVAPLYLLRESVGSAVVPAMRLWGAAVLLSLVFAGVVLACCAWRVLGLGLDPYQRRRVTSILMTYPTSLRAVWKRPEIARLLLPPRLAGSAPTEPQLPREIADALARETPARAEEARALAAELEALDAEIARLASDGDPDEAARLRQRLAALGPESAQEGEERRAMRRLLNEQAGLLERVAARLSEARARRDARAEALRSLWRAAHAEASATRTRSTLPVDGA
jgi:serine/threonine-protein kinase